MVLGPFDDRNTEPYPANYPDAPEGTQLHYVLHALWGAGCKWGAGDDWQCPAHEDSTASLGVRQGEKGVVIHCAAGCESSEILSTLGTAWGVVLGFDAGEVGSEKAGTGGGAPKRKVDLTSLIEQHGKVLATYTYSYWTPGNKLARKVRRREFEDGHKSITQKVFDNQATALYRWDLVEQALKDGRPIYVMEGEKKAAIFNDYAAGKAVATSAPGGAGKWTPMHGLLLANARKIVIVADNDAPGFSHADLVQRSIPTGPIRHIVKSATTGKGDDVVDHLAAGFKIKDLVPFDFVSPDPEDGDKAGELIDGEPDSDEPRERLSEFGKRLAQARNQSWPPSSQPVEVAEAIVSRLFTARDGHPSLRYYRESFWVWDGARYVEQEDKKVFSDLQTALRFARTQDKDGNSVPWTPNKAKIDNVAACLSRSANVFIPSDTRPGTNFVTGKIHSILAFQNGLLDLDALDGELIEPSPRWWTIMAMPFDFDPNAPEPARWMQFLEETWPGDVESHELLQEWFGHVLTTETEPQRFLTIIGATRTGKSTVAKVLKALLGPSSVGLSFQSISGQFGLYPLSVAALGVFNDVRWGGRDGDYVLSTVLSITGGDDMPLDRKNKEIPSQPIPARLMLLANERPPFKDASGALMERLMLLETTHSIPRDRQDPRLLAKLTSNESLAGIVNWAIGGLWRLRKNGDFTRPKSSQERFDDWRRNQVGVGEFVEQTFDFAPDGWVSRTDVYELYRSWCHENGVDDRFMVGIDKLCEQIYSSNYETVKPHQRSIRVPGVKTPRKKSGMLGLRAIRSASASV